jgi:CRISPR/Cas system-associated endoribonuclease Cas2
MIEAHGATTSMPAIEVPHLKAPLAQAAAEWNLYPIRGRLPSTFAAAMEKCQRSSVVFCRLQAVDLIRVSSRLHDVINLDRDQVLFVPLCARGASAIEALGRPIEVRYARDVVIVT